MVSRSKALRLPDVPALSWNDHRLLVDNVVDYAIVMLDVEGHVATWSAGARAIQGYDAIDILGEHLSVFHRPEDAAAGNPQRQLDTARRLGRVEDEGWRVRKDGSQFWANVVITALRDEAGDLRGFGEVTRDLTARRAADEQLRQAEQRFHHLVDAVIDYAIFMLDANGHVATWNAGARRLKGFTTDEIVGRHFSIFYTQQDRADGKPGRILDVVRREGRYEEEGWRVRKDGSVFWANLVLTALRDAHGAVVGFAKVTRDLTERREAEEGERQLLRERTAREVAQEGERRLRESEERYRMLVQRLEVLLEGIADGITAQDRTGRVVFANSAAARMCGFDSFAELLRTPPGDLVASFEMRDTEGKPFDAEELPARRVLAGEPSESMVLHVRERASGRDFWVLVRASAVLAPDGAPELAITIWHDVTNERRHDRQVKYLADATVALASSLDTEQMFEALARRLVPGLADFCTIELLRGPALESAGIAHVDPTKVAQLRALRAVHPPDPAQPNGAWSVVRSGSSQLIDDIPDEMLVAAAQSTEHLAAWRALGMQAALIVPIRARDQVLGAMTLVSTESGRRFDSADRALAEELGRRAGVALENAQLYADAQAAARTAEEASRAKDEFLATVSHELRTPLASILGWSTLLKERNADPAAAKPLAAIHRNAQAQVKIIEDILDVSRVITGKFHLDLRPADLMAVVRDALEVVRPSADAKRIDLELASNAAPCPLVADPERMQQVVWNVLSNAVKFTEPGGNVRASIERTGSQIVLSVRDTGIGIDPEFLPFVFDRFKQADSSTTRRVGGLGLGLALVRHIVELHGGRVGAVSTGVGQGTTVSITLPVRALDTSTLQEAPRAEKVPRVARVAADLSGIGVLVVDDEPDARELVAHVLGSAGARVETAASSREAFAAFERFRPDVLVSDIGMPGEDGYALIRRVRALTTEQGGRIPALALTAFAREEDRTRALSAGYTTHIGKPAHPDALVSAVANLSGVRPRG